MATAKPKPKQARTRKNTLKRLKQIWETQSTISRLFKETLK